MFVYLISNETAAFWNAFNIFPANFPLISSRVFFFHKFPFYTFFPLLFKQIHTNSYFACHFKCSFRWRWFQLGPESTWEKYGVLLNSFHPDVRWLTQRLKQTTNRISWSEAYVIWSDIFKRDNAISFSLSLSLYIYWERDREIEREVVYFFSLPVVNFEFHKIRILNADFQGK